MSNLNYKSDFSSKTLFLYLQDQLGCASPREAPVDQHCHHSLALELKLFLLQLADTPRRLLWCVSQTESFWTWVIWAFSPLLASSSTTLFRKLNYNMITYFLNFKPSYTHTHTHTCTHTHPCGKNQPHFLTNPHYVRGKSSVISIQTYSRRGMVSTRRPLTTARMAYVQWKHTQHWFVRVLRAACWEGKGGTAALGAGSWGYG